ncbi:MAG: hypothetical protein IPL47_07655 [Phyllobacteriaceae bacterium]|nr:hypothetical protein [Phyllobacteriaceae bacterium]
MFLTELFSRPVPRETPRYAVALRFVESLSPADRFDINVKPADFPRLAREMARRN